MTFDGLSIPVLDHNFSRTRLQRCAHNSPCDSACCCLIFTLWKGKCALLFIGWSLWPKASTVFEKVVLSFALYQAYQLDHSGEVSAVATFFIVSIYPAPRDAKISWSSTQKKKFKKKVLSEFWQASLDNIGKMMFLVAPVDTVSHCESGT